jgi:hypothetical protein
MYTGGIHYGAVATECAKVNTPLKMTQGFIMARDNAFVDIWVFTCAQDVSSRVPGWSGVAWVVGAERA